MRILQDEYDPVALLPLVGWILLESFLSSLSHPAVLHGINMTFRSSRILFVVDMDGKSSGVAGGCFQSPTLRDSSVLPIAAQSKIRRAVLLFLGCACVPPLLPFTTLLLAS